MATKKVKAIYYAFNVKLRSNERTGAEAYTELFKELFEKKIVGTPKRGNSMILRTQFNTKIDNNTILYGKLARFTNLDSDEWINIGNLEKSTYELPKGMFPNLKETDYIFIPEAHRFCVRYKAGTVAMSQVTEYLINALTQCRKGTEEIEVYIEQSAETIEQILNSESIKKLDIQISYTNNDIGPEASEFVDEILKDMNASKIKMSISPDHNQELSRDNTFLRGSLELAKSNGLVTASVINANGEAQKIITKEHPESFPVEAENIDNLMMNVVRKFMGIFRV
ncbi:DUF4747 family protein [Ancylomarina sp.]|uniref:DUF4747 family protein n=1 Tax=Ancylomarina sp. TaxID=1970196 RepID=UPI003565EC34